MPAKTLKKIQAIVSREQQQEQQQTAIAVSQAAIYFVARVDSTFVSWCLIIGVYRTQYYFQYFHVRGEIKGFCYQVILSVDQK